MFEDFDDFVVSLTCLEDFVFSITNDTECEQKNIKVRYITQHLKTYKRLVENELADSAVGSNVIFIVVEHIAFLLLLSEAEASERRERIVDDDLQLKKPSAGMEHEKIPFLVVVDDDLKIISVISYVR